MTSEYRERELKFAVADDFVLPDLGPGWTLEASDVRLVSTYFDTDDLALIAHDLTLRRRTGAADEGWQLKVPAGLARDEIQVPVTAELIVPEPLADLVAGVVDRSALRPVATITTARHAVRVRRETADIAEIADDRVEATSTLGHRKPATWREVEIELGPEGTEADLDVLARRLRAAGARPSAAKAKLAQALGEVVRVPGPLEGYLHEQARELVAGDIAWRRNRPDVHDTRVAVRRIRSVLRVFARCFAPDAVAALEPELSWFQDLLGAVRDREVQRARFATLLAELPPELLQGQAAERIEAALAAEQAQAARAVDAALTSDRYRALLRRLLTARPIEREPQVLIECAARAARTADRRWRRAVRTGDDVDLHRARKAIKRARYATEALQPLGDKATSRRIAKYKLAQDVLGEHHDAVVAAALLRRLGTDEPGSFTYGLLYQRELDAEARLRAAVADLDLPR